MRGLTLTLAAVTAMALAGCGGESDQGAANSSTAADNGVENKTAGPPSAPLPPPAPALRAANGQQYVQLASASDLFEIQTSALALQRSQNPQIREFAQMVRTDHERSARELEAAVSDAQPPVELAPALTPSQEADLQALRAAAGPAFDQLYLQQQLRAHEQALGLVTSYSTAGDVSSLSRHASGVAGPIQQHLSRVRTLLEATAAR